MVKFLIENEKDFSKKFEKKYNSIAFTTIIDHIKLSSNNEEIQIFTNNGPIAFLPISKEKTSIVYSARMKKYKNVILIIIFPKQFVLSVLAKEILYS